MHSYSEDIYVYHHAGINGWFADHWNCVYREKIDNADMLLVFSDDLDHHDRVINDE